MRADRHHNLGRSSSPKKVVEPMLLFYDHHTAQRETTRKLSATSRIVHRKLATRWGTEPNEMVHNPSPECGKLTLKRKIAGHASPSDCKVLCFPEVAFCCFWNDVTGYGMDACRALIN
jgi:hypothetical protein